jgi:phosphoglycolate phosphatase-like HAD superfamily hydrolase
MREMETKSTVIFDFDGTIVDSMNAFADIAAEVMPKRLNIDPVTARQKYFETSGLPFFQQLEAIFPGDPANRETAEEYERLKLEGYFEEPLFDDALDTVKCLRESGLRVAVSSNNFQHLVDQFVEKRGMEFDMVLGFKEGFAKGADHFRHLEQELSVPKDEIVFVGDSMKDGERANQYGVNFIAKEGIFTREQFQQSFPGTTVITNLSELKDIFTSNSSHESRVTSHGI